MYIIIIIIIIIISVFLFFFTLCVYSPDVILCGWLGSKHKLTN